jgi:pyruvate kinase
MIEENSRRTKIVKSFEGKALTAEEAAKVASQAVDVLRLVYHPKMVGALIDFIRTVKSHRTNKVQLPIMLDISSWNQGTTGSLKEPREVSFGDKISLSPGAHGDIPVQTDNWNALFIKDAKVFVGAGNVVLQTNKIAAEMAEFEVIQGGKIYPGMEIAVPATRKDPERLLVSPEALSDLLKEGVDYLLINGQWQTQRIVSFRETLRKNHGDLTPWLLVKVDSDDVYERLPQILNVTDGVMISRREMALTMNPATIPMVTKQIIQLCNDQAKIAITASEMLASMRRNVTPTRAEALDAANAVLDGTDAVVLSEEVANGKYGAQAVQVLDRIILDIEEREHVRPNWIKHVPRVENEMDAIAYNAYRTAERVKAKAIVTITKDGNTALKLASFRPPIPVIAVTFSENVRRRLSIVNGVSALKLDTNPILDDVLPVVNDQLVRESWLKPGDAIILVAITLSPVGHESSNLFSIQVLS